MGPQKREFQISFIDSMKGSGNWAKVLESNWKGNGDVSIWPSKKPLTSDNAGVTIDRPPSPLGLLFHHPIPVRLELCT